MAISFGVYSVKAEQLDTVVPNGILPYVTELRIQTSLGKNIVRLNDTLIVELAVSESVIPPVVTINGDIVAMTGDYDSWRGEYVLQQPPITTGVSESVHGEAIPVTVSLEDLSGEATTYNQFGDQQLFYAEYFYQVTDISGTWRLAQKAGAIGVGRAEGSIGDWSSTNFSLIQRDCHFDDTYTFQAADPIYPASGVFTQDMGDSTWYETWQPASNPGGVERCGTPYPPFDGSTENMTYKWDVEAGTLTLNGLGAHIGLPRVANFVENKDEDVTSVTYTIETASTNFIALNILSGGPSPWWHFELERVTNADGAHVAHDSDGNSGSSDGHEDYDNTELAHLIAGEFHYCFDQCNFGGNNHIDEFPQENFDPAKHLSDRYGAGPFFLNHISGNATFSGSYNEFFTNDSSLGFDYAKYHFGVYPYPVTFGDGGYLTFKASVPAGQASTYVKLSFELYDLQGFEQYACSYPDILISGDTDTFYSVQIPSQGDKAFASLIGSLETSNIGVKIYDHKIVSSPPKNAEQINCMNFAHTNGPIITLNVPGDEVKVLTADGSVFYKPASEVTISDNVIAYKQDHDLGESFSDAGAVARDIRDGYVTYQTQGIIDVNIQGIQTIIYTAYDSNGNSSTLIREVNVVDVTPPVITLIGNPTQLVFVDDNTYVVPSATALDAIDMDPSITPTIVIEKKSKQDGSFIVTDFLDISETGEYRYTYTFTDAAGNSASATRKVLVIPEGGDTVVVLEKGNAGIEFESPIQAFDQELNWNSCSSAACPSIDFGFVEDEDRDHQVLQLSHAETSAGAGVFISSSDPIDLRGSREDGIYQLDLKVISGDRRISFYVDCGYPCGGGNQDIVVSEYGVWETFAVPVEDLIPNGPEGNILDLEIVKGGLIIQATGAFGTVFRVDNVNWKCGTTCEGEGVDVPFVPVDWESNHEDLSDGYDAPTSYDGYTQVWTDEFSGNSVDYQKWGFDIGNGDNGWGNGELQYYREENATVDNGMLIIEAKKHQPALPGGITFTSAKLTTADKFQFKYGRVDVRAVVAEGQGLWSTAWMLGANHSQIGWPYSGEIDIVDTIGGVRDGIPQEGMIVNNMYWNATGPNPSEPYSPANINLNGSTEYRINDSNEGETFSNKFHVFSIIWDEDKIQFQVDGIDTVDVNLTNKLADTFRNPFYLILNVAVGGAWPRSPGDNINFPDGMLVDYVRVYQVDTDGDGVADYDLDGDTPLDAFPNNPDESVDTDGDGTGDNADSAPNDADQT